MLEILSRFKQISQIHLYTFGIGCFIASLLYQTDVNQMGTKVALASLFIIVFGALLNINKGKSGKSATLVGLIIAFVLISLLSSFLNRTSPHYLSRYLAFSVTYILICKFQISSFENDFLKDIFSVAMSVYAILTSYSYIYNPITTNYIHSDVLLFGTLMDPNYVSIPFVAAANLCLYRIFERKDLVMNIAMLIVNLLALLCAASRGAVVALLISIILHFLLAKKLNVSKLITIGIIMLILYYLVLPVVLGSFGEQFNRMSDFGFEDDNGRFELWGNAFELFLSKPLLGIGLGGMVDTMGHASHNTYMQVLTETGLLGFVLFLSLILKMLKRAYLLDKTLFIMFVGYLFQIFFVDALGDRLLWLMFIWVAVLGKPGSNKVA